jgi:hypothetical protein
LAQEFSTTYSCGSMSSPVPPTGFAVFRVDCDPLRTKARPARLVAVLAEFRDGVAFLFRQTGVTGFLGHCIAGFSSKTGKRDLLPALAWTSSRLASGCHVAANASVSPEVRSRRSPTLAIPV